MTKKTLRSLFDAMHHHKFSFEDFLSLRVDEHYQQIGWRNRHIYKPSKTLKAVQYFLNSFIFDFLPTNERVSFAYRKSVTLLDAVVPHANSRAFYQTDFEKFFDSITDDLVMATLANAQTPASDLSDHLDRIVELTMVDSKLPIGFVTSPQLSNACMLHFDDRLEKECIRREWIYSRYADDIIVSSHSRDSLVDVESIIRQCATDTLGSKFKLNQSKSRLTTVGRKVKILGLSILPSGRITVDKEMKDLVEVQLHFYVVNRVRLASIYDDDLEKGLERLSGYVSHINAADPLYLEKLRRKFGGAVIDTFLHRSAQ